MFKIIFALVNLGFAIWLIGGLSEAGDGCAGLAGEELSACEAGTAIGGGVAAFMILGLWVFVDVILYIGWRIFRRKPKRVTTGTS